MHSLLTSLIDQWLASGAPDPLNPGGTNPQAARGSNFIDEEARNSISQLEQEFDYLRSVIEQLITETPSPDEIADITWSMQKEMENS